MLATKPYLTQADAQKILDAANQFAAENNFAVTIAVCDDGGHLLGLIRRDGCAHISSYIAQEKARTAAMGKRETRVYEEIINNGRTAFASVPHSMGMLEGGVNIEVNGFTIGAVGVSGVKSADDAATAKAGIAAIL
ncbi:heme-binding protein [Polynucleobacter paludilacus]|uniref:GlcG/HbpS family heme-binding protein n=1 Tax=Polynucleobacter paludilacus TaxID=1855895 RepID=UPI001BFE7715|nr:heme-binding protein [Polynucleobacter paludilacus]QWD87423.1 heme-binding protein [Polynucleobacter paludilacus]